MHKILKGAKSNIKFKEIRRRVHGLKSNFRRFDADWTK